jgi:hypothetical protein
MSRWWPISDLRRPIHQEAVGKLGGVAPKPGLRWWGGTHDPAGS